MQRQKGLNAKDPLLNKGQNKEIQRQLELEKNATPRSERAFQLTMLTLSPFCVFVLVLFTTVYMFYKSPLGVMLLFTAVAAGSGAQFLLVDVCLKKKQGKWKRYLGGFSFVAACVAFAIALAIHYKWMLFFYKYTSMVKYTNVAPLQPAMSFADAGTLQFTAGTTVDRTRAVGYRHIRKQQTLCVAPIVSPQMSPTDDIVFFAVGTNCCGWRSNFHCDDAGGSAQGGLLMLSPDQLVSPAMEWMVDEQFDFKAFEKAIELEKSVFAMTVAKNYRLMRWVASPEAAVDYYRKRALEAALLSCVAYWVAVGCITAWHLRNEESRAQQRMKELIANEGSPAAQA